MEQLDVDHHFGGECNASLVEWSMCFLMAAAICFGVTFGMWGRFQRERRKPVNHGPFIPHANGLIERKMA